MESKNILALLRIRFPDGSEHDFEVTKSPFSLGRASTNDVQLAGSKVSRQHARLLFEDERVLLIDLNSSNGTWIEDTRLSPNRPYILEYGQAFTISSHTLRIERGFSSSSPETALTASTSQEERPGLAVEPEHTGSFIPDTPSPTSSGIGEKKTPGVSTAPTDSPQTVQLGVTAAPPLPPHRPPPPPSKASDQLPAGNGHTDLVLDSSRYLKYLPPIYAENKFLEHYLLAFEAVLTPIEQIADNFDLFLNPKTTPGFFLDQLAGWLALTLDEKWSEEKRRLLLSEAAELFRRRGTRWSLSRYLEIYTGLDPDEQIIIAEPEDQPHLFSVVLRVPAKHTVDRATVRRIIEASKPAHTIYTLEIFRGK